MTEQAKADPLAEALTWIEDQDPDGDEDVGQTGWSRNGEFFVPKPTAEHPDTVEYVGSGKVADFALWARAEIVRLREALGRTTEPQSGVRPPSRSSASFAPTTPS